MGMSLLQSESKGIGTKCEHLSYPAPCMNKLYPHWHFIAYSVLLAILRANPHMLWDALFLLSKLWENMFSFSDIEDELWEDTEELSASLG